MGTRTVRPPCLEGPRHRCLAASPEAADNHQAIPDLVLQAVRQLWAVLERRVAADGQPLVPEAESSVLPRDLRAHGFRGASSASRVLGALEPPVLSL